MPRFVKRGNAAAGRPLAAHYGLPDEQIHPAVREAWRRGLVRNIPGKLELTQRGMLEQLEAIDRGAWAMILASRKIGKTWLACVLMLEHCLQNSGAQVLYLAPIAKNIKEPVLEIMDELLQDCPMSAAPAWNTGDRAFIFDNGSKIRVVGASSGRASTLRGAKATMLVVDECSFLEDLDRVVRAVLGPMTLRNPTAVKLMLTSAPDVPHHQVIQFIADHRSKGTLVERTILDRVGETDAEKQRIELELQEAIVACGGRDTQHFRREYLNELVFDTNRTVIPEWHDAALVLGKNAVSGKPDGTGLIREVPLPDCFVAVVGWDPGFHHHSGVVFGYVDFTNRWLVVLDEIDRVKTISSDLAPLVLEKEKQLWGIRRPIRIQRVMDNDPEAQGQMLKENLLFAGIGKKELRSQVNQLRKLVKEGRLIVHPRCTKLIACLYRGTWRPMNAEDSVLKFTEDGELGHFDLLAALIYMNVRAPFDENPNPEPLREWNPYRKPESEVLASFNTATNRWSKPSAQAKLFGDAFADSLHGVG
jgi:hypothetical protein